MKKMDIGSIENEGALRFFQNEGTEKNLYKISETAGYYSVPTSFVKKINPGCTFLQR